MTTLFRSTFVALAAVSVCYAQAVISTVAGNGTLVFSGDGGPATKAGVGIPPDMAVDGAGNLYIVDRNNNRIRKVDTSGTIGTFAGNGTSDSSGDGGPATSAALFLPIAIAVDGAGNVYIADPGEGLRKVDTAGIINSVPVIGSFLSKIASPGGMTVDSAGNVYVSDLNGSAIYKLDKTGVLTTVAGGTLGFSGDGGPATKAALYFPSGVAIDSAGNIYFADKGNNRVRKVDTKGVITTFAGTGTAGYSGDGGPATSAKLGLNLTAAFQGVAVDSAGDVYIADPANNRIRMVNPAGIIGTFAGNGGPFATGSLGNGDGGPPASASVSTPYGVRVDSAGNVFIADTGHNLIRKVTGAATGGGSPPAISANGVVNGASFQPGIVANSWVTIQGRRSRPQDRRLEQLDRQRRAAHFARWRERHHGRETRIHLLHIAESTQCAGAGCARGTGHRHRDHRRRHEFGLRGHGQRIRPGILCCRCGQAVRSLRRTGLQPCREGRHVRRRHNVRRQAGRSDCPLGHRIRPHQSGAAHGCRGSQRPGLRHQFPARHHYR